jgi:hypothetical protein
VSIGAWIDRLPMAPLLIIAVLLGLAPFVPEPHLVEKLRMLGAGTLRRPLDIFDLLMHAAPLLLIAVKLLRRRSALPR